jgi:MFS family permease
MHAYPLFSKNIMRWIKQLNFGLLWPFYISQAIQSIFAITTAYWVVYFLDIGYSFTSISLLPTIMLLTTMVLELPTGFLADLKGRKWTVVIAIFIEASALTLIPFVGVRLEILIGLYVLMGVGAALLSGASEAWVVDFLHWHAKPGAIPFYYAGLHAFINIGFIIAPLLASAIFLFTGALHYLWWIEGIMFFSAGLILTIFGKEKREEQKRFKLTLALLYQKVITHIRECPILTPITAVMFLFAIIFGMTTLAWQPFLQTKGVPLAWFGVLHIL